MVPGVEDEATGTVFTVFAEFALFEDAEGFVDAAGTADVFGVEDVAEFVGSKSVEVGYYCIEFCLQNCATVRVEYKWFIFPMLGISLRCSSVISSHSSSAQASIS